MAISINHDLQNNKPVHYILNKSKYFAYKLLHWVFTNLITLLFNRITHYQNFLLIKVLNNTNKYKKENNYVDVNYQLHLQSIIILFQEVIHYF